MGSGFAKVELWRRMGLSGMTVLGLTVLVWLASPVWADAACRDDTVWLRGDFGTARFGVEVADDGPERAQGLMHVASMPAGRGMLFVYSVPRDVAFWMKNTLIPLDMIFADENGVVVKIHENAIPGDLTSIPGEGLVQFVLEINGGLSRKLGLKEGAQLRHPAIEDAAWPCD